MGQQFYVIRRNPAPGSPAAEALEKRNAAKAARHPTRTAPGDAAANGQAASTGGSDVAPADGQPDADSTPAARPGQRQQPKRAKKKRGPTPR
jgi:YidC/Oxa1 family membrane protein insertase